MINLESIMKYITGNFRSPSSTLNITWIYLLPNKKNYKLNRLSILIDYFLNKEYKSSTQEK